MITSLFAGRSCAGVLTVGVMLLAGACQSGPPASPADRTTAVGEEIEFDYQLEMEAEAGFRPALDDEVFHTGDCFRISLWADFAAHIYLLDRSPGASTYQIFLNTQNGREAPIARNVRTTLPSAADKCFRLDKSIGDEDLILLAATEQLPRLVTASAPQEEAERILAELQRSFQPPSIRRFVDGDWVKLIGAGRKEMVLMVRLPLRHE